MSGFASVVDTAGVFGRGTPKELLYSPLTRDDEAIHRDWRYRVGRWIERHAYGSTLFSVLLVGVLPLVLILDHWESDEVTPKQELLLTLLWALSVFVAFTWSFFKRQERSELRRSYRFRVVDHRDDPDVAGAKRVLVGNTSTEQEREHAVELLMARGAFSPYRPDRLGSVLAWAGAIVLVGLFFFLALWLPQTLLDLLS